MDLNEISAYASIASAIGTIVAAFAAVASARASLQSARSSVDAALAARIGLLGGVAQEIIGEAQRVLTLSAEIKLVSNAFAGMAGTLGASRHKLAMDSYDAAAEMAKTHESQAQQFLLKVADPQEFDKGALSREAGSLSQTHAELRAKREGMERDLSSLRQQMEAQLATKR